MTTQNEHKLIISLHQAHAHPMMNPNKPNRCTSTLSQPTNAPLPLVWSLVRRFDRPHVYKTLNKTCTLLEGDGQVGSVREVALISGLPGRVSRERLDLLDDDSHVMAYSTIRNDQRLDNYRSVTTVHETDGGGGTVVVESYVVDVPEGNSEEETRAFVDTVMGCNLRSLARVAEKLAACDGCS